MKIIQDWTVKQINFLNEDTFILDLQLDKIPEKISAGNFAEIRIDNSQDVFLRRPFSVYSVDYSNNTVGFFIKRIGKGTNILSKLEEGETINMIYPLGNSFGTDHKGKALVVGGGSGIAPLILIGKELKEQGTEVIHLLGGRSKRDILLIEEFSKYGEVFYTTEDGTFGEKGLVTDHSLFKKVQEFTKIYTCGPDPMMKAIAKIATNNGIDCEVSLENTMACGFGVCLCCVTETTSGNKCVCTDGPVFNVKDLKW